MNILKETTLNGDSLNKPVDGALKQTKSVSVNGRTVSQEFTDVSGLVKIKLFYESFGPTSYNISNSVHVDADYVLVGGSAWVENTEAGALLTESRPDFYNNDWYATSKEHAYFDSHTLHIVAIGLRLEGVTSDALRSYMQVFSIPGGTQSAPSASVTIPTGYLLLGGGTKINWTAPGNLLVHSYPAGNTWNSKGKDHLYSSPASITSYAIAIQDVNIPGFGFLESAISSASQFSSSGTKTVGVTIPSGWIVTCPGGRVSYGSWGRMLTGIQIPTDSPFTSSVTSKDQGYADGGTTFAYAVRIRKKP
ncbi:MAG: hypothetical protein ORN54_01425 [Cyclobacteriaceae bacterium]|nr:hypothetical protein [Cyclobacteriaceae bacterium]